MQNLTSTDYNLYLKFGNLTQPFLSGEFVNEMVNIDYNYKIHLNPNYTKLEGLFNWINHNVRFLNDKNFSLLHKFQRSAKEIWESKVATGCTDYALLFATFARQLGIPTTFLHTAEQNWVNRLKNNEDYKIHYGHSFCECFYNNNWVLVDPTSKKIELNYNSNLIELSYSISNNNKFIPYFRGLDLQTKQTVKEHNQIMEDICKTI